MSRFNTVVRLFCTVAVVLALAQIAAAQSVQSVLNFPGVAPGGGPASLAVTNLSSNIADVQFTLYNADGTLASGPLNPVSYRAPAKGQILMKPEDLFGARPSGWIQATSSTAGLQGFYFTGDFKNTLDGAESLAPQASEQWLPFLSAGNILITNPSGDTASGSVTFYSADGVGAAGPSITLPSHGQTSISIPSSGASARITTSVAVLATAVVERSGAIMLVNGRDIPLAVGRIVPHFVSGNGIDSTLVLTNPTSSTVSLTLRLFNADSPAAPAYSVDIRAFRSIKLTASDLYGRTPTPVVNNGWVRIDAAAQSLVALNGMVILDSGVGLTAIPIQLAPSDRILFSSTLNDQDLMSQLALVTTDSTANVTIALSRKDGSTLDQVNKTIPANSKFLAPTRELFPSTTNLGGSFITVRSSVPIYATEIVGPITQLLASVSPQTLPVAYAAPPILPKIIRLSDTNVRPGGLVTVSVVNVGDNVSFAFGNQPAKASSYPFGFAYAVEVPQLEPGFVNLKLRVDGSDVDVVTLRVLDDDGVLTQTLKGRAFYQKIPVTDAGLDLSEPFMAPIRNARVEVVDRSQQSIVVSVSETDANGQFIVAVPNESALTIRVVSRLRNLDLRVADNTNNSALYGISADVDMREQQGDVMLIDVNATPNRVSGAFNILEAIERGNDLIAKADPRITLPSFTMFWSVRNTARSGKVANGFVGGTFFSLATGTAYILGDRATDSDEFDDSVLLHEYAHMLAVKFSRDDSPGGQHALGDVLDPRVAWSEAWANFFSSAARNNPIYRDSSGPNGINVLRYNLEDNVPATDHPGYWSEASIESLLWDLFDEANDDGDSSQFDFAAIWAAFADLRNDHFVYLPYFLDHFIERNPESADVVRVMAQLRSVIFQPGTQPSVANPFPVALPIGRTATGEVDSLTGKRTNLMSSSHFYSFTTTGGAAGIRLDIDGLGPGNSPAANDLDLYLLDLNGRIIAKSNTSDPKGELIRGLTLPAGAYLVEVRSFYTDAGTGTVVYNSGHYSLTVKIQ